MERQLSKTRGTLARRDTGLTRFQQAMNELFDRFFEDWEMPFGGEATLAPSLDVMEKEDSIVVKAELPGVRPEDIDISVQGNALVISGEKKEDRQENLENYYRLERRYGSFRRAIPLTGEVNAEKIEAVHRDGVLTVTLPKTEMAKPRHIKVQAETEKK